MSEMGIIAAVALVLFAPTLAAGALVYFAVTRKNARARAEGIAVPAAWLADPTGRHELRYWDGAIWTGHVIDAGVQTEEGDAL